MSSHFLLQHVQIFLAKNARRQPTGMTEKGANFRSHWDISLNLCNEPTKTKMVFTSHFYLTDVKYSSSNMYLREQPYSSTSHQSCLQCHSSTLHSQRFRFKTDLAGLYMEVPWFPRFLQQLPVAFRQKPGSAEKEKHKSSFLREEKREGKDWDYLLRRCWLLHLLSPWKPASERGRRIDVAK